MREEFADLEFMISALRIVIVTSLFSMALVSCSPTLKETCQTKIPALEKEFTQVDSEVAALTPRRDVNRAIASVSTTESYAGDYRNHVFDVSRNQKDHWEDWSEARLVQTQHFIDYVRPDSHLRKAMPALTNLANELVAFDGYVERGQLLRMHESLQRAESDANTAAQSICGPVLSSQAR